MNPHTSINEKPGYPMTRLLAILILLLTSTIACNIPFVRQYFEPKETITEDGVISPTHSQTPTITPTPRPLPPALVEVEPVAGAVVPVNSPFTFYFNQPMDKPSVEAALKGSPNLSASFQWLDDATLMVQPARDFLPNTQFTLELDTSARAANGLSLIQPLQISYRTAGLLRAVEFVPEPGSENIDPTRHILVTFNQPVVPLGADPNSLPAAFSIEPATPGHGEWINSGTYVYYPEPALLGGTQYRIQLNPDLTSTAGTPLENASTWVFTTSPPAVLEVSPQPDPSPIRLDQVFRIRFNQPMDTEATEASFSLLASNGEPVPGTFGWEDNATTLVFTPTKQLTRSTTYYLSLNQNAKSASGTPLLQPLSLIYITFQPLFIASTDPPPGGSTRWGISLYPSAPIDEGQDLKSLVEIDPPTDIQWIGWSDYTQAINIQGDFKPSSNYTLTIKAGLRDLWGGVMESPFSIQFRTMPLSPEINLGYGSNDLFVRASDTSLGAQAVNISYMRLAIGNLPFDDFIRISQVGAFDEWRNYYPPQFETWDYYPDLPPNVNQLIEIPLTPDKNSLSPGLYFLRILESNAPYNPGPLMLIASDIHLTFKLSYTEVFVWAIDLRNNQPVPGAPVSIYSFEGRILTQGVTDEQGVFRSSIDMSNAWKRPVYAMLASPGDEFFSFTSSQWSGGIEPREFGIWQSISPPTAKTHLYTDRPIYRPGQTIYFKAITRMEENGRYMLPQTDAITITLRDPNYNDIQTFVLPLSDMGTASSEWHIPENIEPGYYSLYTQNSRLRFQIANYRKPEIDLQVNVSPEPAVIGTTVTAEIEARYFFDAPANNIELSWTLYAYPESFTISRYFAGAEDVNWFDYYPWMGEWFSGYYIESGSGKTEQDGKLTLSFDADTFQHEHCPAQCRYMLEVTLNDEIGFPISSRAFFHVHPDTFYIGVRPDVWIGRAETEIGFDVVVVDWDKNPAGEQSLHAEFQQVEWVQQSTRNIYDLPTYKKQTTLISTADFRTGSDGRARLAFTPPKPGTYQLVIYADSGARTEKYIWVGGVGQAIWPAIPNQKLTLVPDQESYQAGDTAHVFIPNPLGNGTKALISIERGNIFHYEIIELDESGLDYQIPITDEYSPNVYLAVTLLGQKENGYHDFRHGYATIHVTPTKWELQIDLVAEPQRTEPGGEVQFTIQVKDTQGNPVQGEFSLSAVDKAVLALADPNSPNILSDFYGTQMLGVKTSLLMTIDSRRLWFIPGGVGGGGGGEETPPNVRSDFLDTAYWNAQIITDENGMATITVPFPDNLTTWQIEVRGATSDTRVGQTSIEVVATKDLLIRPVTPRFTVAGDHLQLGAIVHNNTDADIQAQVALQANGFRFDNPSEQVQAIAIPAHGRVQVNWWGKVDNAEVLSLIFSVEGGGYQDATTPVWGDIPVLSYTASQVFVTSGFLSEPGEMLEIVSLPRTFDPSSGELHVELSPSLLASISSALDALEHYPYECNEQTVSRFLPNLVTYQAINQLGLDATELEARLERTLNKGLQRLLARQNQDGGWGWWEGDRSNPYISTYVLFGLVKAQEAGILIDETAVQNAANYLIATLSPPEALDSTWNLDRTVFSYYVLTDAGYSTAGGIAAIYEQHTKLSPWAEGLLALMMETTYPGDARIQTLLSDLEGKAIRNASGTHWASSETQRWNVNTPLYNTAIVIYTLSRLNPESTTLPNAVRYLMLNRSAEGTWFSTYETAWAIMALTSYASAQDDLNTNFAYTAELNGTPILQGESNGVDSPTISTSIPIAQLYPEDPNALVIHHDKGEGTLFYQAQLEVNRPVEDIAPVNKGIHIERLYTPFTDTCLIEKCAPIQQGNVGDVVQVQLAISLESDAYYLIVEDYFPAGGEIVDINLNTTKKGLLNWNIRPFTLGYGFWRFSQPQIYDDHIAWSAEYLPAGSYELTYLITLNQPGEYQVIPSRAWEFYFPDVAGNSNGTVFNIQP